jgi:sugar phosphate isomerase/epimerase
MVDTMVIGCVEFSVPGKTLEDKLRVLKPHKLWLELVNDGLAKKRLKDIFETIQSFKVPVKSVQANLLRDLHPLGKSRKDREIAMRHVEETMKLASMLDAKNVVTVATYGEPMAEDPMQKCVDNYTKLSKLGAELGVTVSIEPLGKNRTTFLPSLEDVCDLVRKVGSEYVRPMADTMHISDNGENVAKVIGKHARELAELQLRDIDSKPPGRGSIDFKSVLKAIKGNFKGLICLEYRSGQDPYADLECACEFVNGLISEVR